MDDVDEKRLDLFCPQCNILVSARVRATAMGSVTEEVASMIGPEDSLYAALRYELALCGRCSGPFLVETRSYEVPGEFTSDDRQRVLFPMARPAVTEGVPLTAARAYDQAARSFQAGLYEPCAIMCRKCLEALCVELQASGRTLKAKLDDLQKKGVIDTRLLEWADQLRVVGNDAAHDLDLVIDKDDARDAIEFLEALFLYTFSLGKRFEAFVLRRKKQREAKNLDAPG